MYKLCSFACVTVVMMGLLHANAAESDNRISLSMRLPDSIVSTQPCLVHVTFHNNGDTVASEDLGYGGYGAFSFELLDANSKTVRTSGMIRNGGMTISGKIVVNPGSSVERDLVLNNWVNTELPSGAYELVVHFSGGDKLSATGKLRVAEADDAKLTAIYDQLASQALDFTRGTVASRSFALLQLSTASRDVAVPSLAKVLTNKTDSDCRAAAARTLGRIHTIQSLKALMHNMDLLRLEGNQYVEQETLRSIFEIKDGLSDDADVERLASLVTRDRKRPAPRQPITVYD